MKGRWRPRAKPALPVFVLNVDFFFPPLNRSDLNHPSQKKKKKKTRRGSQSAATGLTKKVNVGPRRGRVAVTRLANRPFLCEQASRTMRPLQRLNEKRLASHEGEGCVRQSSNTPGSCCIDFNAFIFFKSPLSCHCHLRTPQHAQRDHFCFEAEGLCCVCSSVSANCRTRVHLRDGRG